MAAPAPSNHGKSGVMGEDQANTCCNGGADIHCKAWNGYAEIVHNAKGDNNRARCASFPVIKKSCHNLDLWFYEILNLTQNGLATLNGY